MEPKLIEQYDRARDLEKVPFRAACYAPFVSMVFDTIGRVRACCVNFDYLLGNIREQRIGEIWSGEPIEKLREALLNYEFKFGCEYCEFKIGEGSFEGKNFANTLLQTLKYDPYAKGLEIPYKPRHLEFHMSNVCNLECAMCHGEFSSSIRSHREGLPAIPKAYDDQFFEDLADYLPSLMEAHFLGGEPFLIKEQFRVWEMLIEMNLSPYCHVTTNGTQYNERVERIIDRLPFTFCISMDGATKETFESIRLKADWDVVVANVARFHDYSRRHGRRISFSFTLSRLNWHEFGDFLVWAEQWEAPVSVSTLFYPHHLSLHTLPKSDLESIVRYLDERESAILPELNVNRQVWKNYLEELRYTLAHGDQHIFQHDEGGPEVVQIAGGSPS